MIATASILHVACICHVWRFGDMTSIDQITCYMVNLFPTPQEKLQFIIPRSPPGQDHTTPLFYIFLFIHICFFLLHATCCTHLQRKCW